MDVTIWMVPWSNWLVVASLALLSGMCLGRAIWMKLTKTGGAT